MSQSAILTCPFCDFKHNHDYEMLLHVEIHHSEDGDSPFVVRDQPSDSMNGSSLPAPAAAAPAPATAPASTHHSSPAPSQNTTKYVDCPYKCGERVEATELQFHTDYHMAEGMAVEDSSIVSEIEFSSGACNDEQAVREMSKSFTHDIHNSIRNQDQLISTSPQKYDKRKTVSLKELFFGSQKRKREASGESSSSKTKIRRLGTAELGPYAHEKKMPSWLYRMLEEGAKVTISNKIGPNGTLLRVEAIANETPNLIDTLARLSALDKTVAKAVYCSSEVRHVAKMNREGGFCGYRNIQMLISHIRDTKGPGYEHFPGRLPSILKLQDMIERAWDMGYNSTGRIETGGIKSTRKYIGTPEAHALFSSLGIPCEARVFTGRGEGNAYTDLMAGVFNYFEDEQVTEGDGHRVIITDKSPIYFQHHGHSMTIVGVEVHTSGAANLVVFDPMFNPSPTMKKISSMKAFRVSEPARFMRAYRRGEAYLSKYNTFELLMITDPRDGVSTHRELNS